MPNKKSTQSILIVEDEKPIAHALKLKFESEGYQTYCAFDGGDALDILSKKSFNCILLDLVMPRKDGFAVLAEMKEKSKKIPIIVLSNLGQESDSVRCRELGATEYFIKADVAIADVVLAVKKLLR